MAATMLRTLKQVGSGAEAVILTPSFTTGIFLSAWYRFPQFPWVVFFTRYFAAIFVIDLSGTTAISSPTRADPAPWFVPVRLAIFPKARVIIPTTTLTLRSKRRCHPPQFNLAGMQDSVHLPRAQLVHHQDDDRLITPEIVSDYRILDFFGKV